jgi:cytoplasmic iron level regulating protein YaaA (DUF328/UPF0246 family)
VALDELAFPELTGLRRRVVDALVATSGSPDAFARLHVGPGFAAEVARNTALLDLPAMPAHELYHGPLHQGLDLASASSEARARAAREVVITSAVWGAIRPDDRIAAYRCGLFSRLIGMDRLDHVWRTTLPAVLADAARDDAVIVDLRAPTFQGVGMPAGAQERTVTLRIEGRGLGHRIGDVVAKRVRGEAARFLLESGVDPDHPAELAEVLGDRWPVELDAGGGRGRSWTLSLVVAD